MLAGLALGSLGSAGARAQEKEPPPPRPAVVDALYACQQQADPAARLACYDQAVATIRTAEEERNVIFTDREQVREARRGLFGFGNIKLGGIFGGGDGDDDDMQQIDVPLKSITVQRDGKLLFGLADGSTWAQTDTTRPRLRELKAKSIQIRRGPLGSFIAELDGGTPLKVKRLN